MPSVRLDEILTQKKLVALVDNSTTSYFIYRGRPMGFEFELLDRFANHLGVELVIEKIDNLDSVVIRLKRGDAHLAAANITVTKERAELLNFCTPHMLSRQVLVQRLPEGYWRKTFEQVENQLLRNPIELAEETVYVSKSSAFYSRLLNLSEEIGDDITILEPDGPKDPESLIRQVAKGEIGYTVADENIAKINKKYHPNIDIKTAISFPQKIAWAVAKDGSDNLLDTLNSWITQMKKSKDYAVITGKYFKARTQHTSKVMSEFSSANQRISPYDDLIKQTTKNSMWDWRLIAAQAYQESNFDSLAESWTGAKGLMQIIPANADSGENLFNPETNLRIGVDYLSWLFDQWSKVISDTTECIKFSLASYNVGLGHIRDAHRLCQKYGGDPLVWDGEVAEYILKKSDKEYYRDEVVKHGYCRGREPYNYVREILSRYGHYRNHVGR